MFVVKCLAFWVRFPGENVDERCLKSPMEGCTTKLGIDYRRDSFINHPVIPEICLRDVSLKWVNFSNIGNLPLPITPISPWNPKDFCSCGQTFKAVGLGIGWVGEALVLEFKSRPVAWPKKVVDMHGKTLSFSNQCSMVLNYGWVGLFSRVRWVGSECYSPCDDHLWWWFTLVDTCWYYSMKMLWSPCFWCWVVPLSSSLVFFCCCWWWWW